MVKRFKPNIDRSLPSGWPEDIPLPTLEESKETVRKGERMIVNMLNDLRSKVTGPTPEMLRTIITI
jgi:hypothetical protein